MESQKKSGAPAIFSLLCQFFSAAFLKFVVLKTTSLTSQFQHKNWLKNDAFWPGIGTKCAKANCCSFCTFQSISQAKVRFLKSILIGRLGECYIDTWTHATITVFVLLAQSSSWPVVHFLLVDYGYGFWLRRIFGHLETGQSSRWDLFSLFCWASLCFRTVIHIIQVDLMEDMLLCIFSLCFIVHVFLFLWQLLV